MQSIIHEIESIRPRLGMTSIAAVILTSEQVRDLFRGIAAQPGGDIEPQPGPSSLELFTGRALPLSGGSSIEVVEAPILGVFAGITLLQDHVARSHELTSIDRKTATTAHGRAALAAVRLRERGTWVDSNPPPPEHTKARWSVLREQFSGKLTPEQWDELEALWGATGGLTESMRAAGISIAAAAGYDFQTAEDIEAALAFPPGKVAVE